MLTKTGYIDGAAQFFELNDEQLDYIRNNSKYYLDADKVKEFINAKGDNAHFFGLFNNNKSDAHLIYKNLKVLLKDYKTVSWWDKDMNEFKIRSEICHQSQ
jgi:hypothetical protein